MTVGTAQFKEFKRLQPGLVVSALMIFFALSLTSRAATVPAQYTVSPAQLRVQMKYPEHRKTQLDYFGVFKDAYKDDPALKSVVEAGRTHHKAAATARQKEQASLAAAEQSRITRDGLIANYDGSAEQLGAIKSADQQMRGHLQDAQNYGREAASSENAEKLEREKLDRMTRSDEPAGHNHHEHVNRGFVPVLPPPQPAPQGNKSGGSGSNSNSNSTAENQLADTSEAEGSEVSGLGEEDLKKFTSLSDEDLIRAALGLDEVGAAGQSGASLNRGLTHSSMGAHSAGQGGGSGSGAGEASENSGWEASGSSLGVSHSQDSGSHLQVGNVLTHHSAPGSSSGNRGALNRGVASVSSQRPDSTSGRLLRGVKTGSSTRFFDARGMNIALGKDWLLVKPAGAPDLELPANAYSVHSGRAVTNLKVPRFLNETLKQNTRHILGSTRSVSHSRVVTVSRASGPKRAASPQVRIVQGSYVEGRWHEGIVLPAGEDGEKAHRAKDPFATETEEELSPGPVTPPPATVQALENGELGGFYKRAIESVQPLLEKHGMSIKP